MRGTMLLASNSWAMHDVLVSLAAGRTRLVHVITAGNTARRRENSRRESARLRELGFQVTEYDIAGKGEPEVRDALGGADIIFIRGGNTFYLLQQARACNLGRVLRELLAAGTILFANSAGSYICCPTIEAASWPPADKNCVGLFDLTGLGLVPFLISAHYAPPHDTAVDAAAAAATEASGRPVELLADHEALLIADGAVTRITTP